VEALANLIENAGRYSTTGSAIRVAAERTRDRATITVARRRPRHSARRCPWVFDKFYSRRADEEHRHRPWASIAKAMVELCGGTIALRSGPTGSTTISLPAAEVRASGARILVVDDDPAILRAVRRALEAREYDVRVLESRS
jgi:K+-sensing histidine kinase KdpD